MDTDADRLLLRRLDDYLDAAPRFAATAEPCGPFTLFVHRNPGWPYYARPTPGAGDVVEDDIRAVRERQRELATAENLEWVVELVPSVGRAAEAAGLVTREHPMLYLDVLVPSALPEGFEIRFATPDADLARWHAVAAIGFDAPGTARGEEGIAEVEDRVSAGVDASLLSMMHERLASGLTISAAVIDLATGQPVASGAHQPLDGTSEIVGVATLPAFRRRGIGASLTSALARDAMMRDCDTIFLSAGDAEIARVYERIGFRRIGTAGAAEPPGPVPSTR